MATVLIVDDEILICEALKQLVEQEGYQVYCAFDGKQAMRILRDFAPDLVITDIIMPEKDGLELISEIRQVSKQTKIMAISGGGTNILKEPQLKVAQLLGADLCIPKPLNNQFLLNSINILLQ